MRKSIINVTKYPETIVSRPVSRDAVVSAFGEEWVAEVERAHMLGVRKQLVQSYSLFDRISRTILVVPRRVRRIVTMLFIALVVSAVAKATAHSPITVTGSETVRASTFWEACQHAPESIRTCVSRAEQLTGKTAATLMEGDPIVRPVYGQAR